MSSLLVYHAGGLGDFVLSLPAIFRTAEAFPSYRCHFWGPTDRLSLLPGFVPPPAALVRFGHTLWSDAPNPSALEALSNCSIVLAFGGRAPSSTFAEVRGTRVLPIAGFPSRGGLRAPAHQSTQLDALGVPRPPGPWLPTWRRTVFAARKQNEIMLHPGSGDQRKNVPAKVWGEVLEPLRERTGLRARLVLGPVEREDRAWEALREKTDTVTVCEDITELLAALSRAKLFLGNDSGATHLAAMVGVRTVAVFGPSDPTLWRPLGPRVGVVRTNATCAPCSDGSPFACREPLCLTGISATDIVAKALELLAGPLTTCQTTTSIC